jgi:outer membrane biosynthesis protein TonB
MEELNMEIWGFRPKGDVLTSVAVGVGILAAPVVMPVAWSAVRPLLKAVLKTGFVLCGAACGAVPEGSGPEKIETSKPEEPIKVAEPTKPTTEDEHVIEHKSEDIKQKTEKIEKAEHKEAKSKTEHSKPKRQTKTPRKKTVQETQI